MERRIAERLPAHRAELLAYASSRAASRSEAEDVVQETLLRALDRAVDLRDPARLRGWLFAILRRVLTDRARRAGRELPGSDLDTIEVEPEREVPIGCECAAGLRSTLKPEYTTILERVIVEEHTLAEVAAELGVSVNNATVRLHRARKALREKIARLCGIDTYAAAIECEHDARCA